MRKPRTLSPVERAMLVHQWRTEAVTGRIHALIGGDSDKLAGGAGRIFYVTLGGCIASGIGMEDTDVRILRGACNALEEQAEQPEVDENRRASIVSGLHACDRLLPRLSQKGLAESALQMDLMLKYRSVMTTDFARLVEHLRDCQKEAA